MRSVRIDDELDARMQDAASREGVTVSEFIRAAVAERTERVLERDSLDGWHDFIGVGRGTGAGVARRTGEAFTELLVDSDRARRRPPDG